MKQSTRAPAYAFIYHGLAEVARSHGYALSIHGSMLDDLDLVAIPWVEDAVKPFELYMAIRNHCEVCLNHSEENKHLGPEIKPHGRMAWKLFMDGGSSVDLSVMQKTS